MILAVFGSGVLFQHVHHIHRTQVRMGFPPCPVENAYFPILFSAPNVLDRGDPATQHIRSFPVLRAEINQLFLRRGDIVRRAECRLGGKGQTVQAGTAVQRDRDLPDTLCAVNRKNSLGACLRVAGQRRRADRHSVGIHRCQRGVPDSEKTSLPLSAPQPKSILPARKTPVFLSNIRLSILCFLSSCVISRCRV